MLRALSDLSLAATAGNGFIKGRELTFKPRICLLSIEGMPRRDNADCLLGYPEELLSEGHDFSRAEKGRWKRYSTLPKASAQRSVARQQNPQGLKKPISKGMAYGTAEAVP